MLKNLEKNLKNHRTVELIESNTLFLMIWEMRLERDLVRIRSCWSDFTCHLQTESHGTHTVNVISAKQAPSHQLLIFSEF